MKNVWKHYLDSRWASLPVLDHLDIIWKTLGSARWFCSSLLYEDSIYISLYSTQHTVHKVPTKSECGTADILSPTCRDNEGIPPLKDLKRSWIFDCSCIFLVASFNPCEKYARQIGSFPKSSGDEHKNVWVATTCHHLATHFYPFGFTSFVASKSAKHQDKPGSNPLGWKAFACISRSLRHGHCVICMIFTHKNWARDVPAGVIRLPT